MQLERYVFYPCCVPLKLLLFSVSSICRLKGPFYSEEAAKQYFTGRYFNISLVGMRADSLCMLTCSDVRVLMEATMTGHVLFIDFALGFRTVVIISIIILPFLALPLPLVVAVFLFFVCLRVVVVVVFERGGG